MLAAATELDPSIATRCAEANGNPRAAYPTLALALAVLPEAAWDVVSPQRPLRYWRLIELDEPRAEALTATRIRIDERIVSFLKGLNVMDERLALLIHPVTADLPLSLPRQPRAGRGGDHRGADRGGKRRAPAGDRARRNRSRRAARAGGQRGAAPRPRALRGHARAGALGLPRSWRPDPAVGARNAVAAGAPLRRHGRNLARGLRRDRRAAASRCAVTCWSGCREPRPLRSRRLRVIDAPRPTAEEQQALWQELLADDAETASRLASEFDLSQLVIADVVRQVEHSGAGARGLWAACRAQTRPRLDTLARRVEPVAGWDDLVLPEAELTLLRHIVDQVRGRATCCARGAWPNGSPAAARSRRCSPAGRARARPWPPR